MSKGKKLVLLCLSLAVLALSACGGREAKPTSTGPVVQCISLQKFDLGDTRVQENPDVQVFANALPADFANMVKGYLDVMKPANSVAIVETGAPSASGCAVVSGKFTKITAGSTAARLLVGFGAGASTVGASWTITDPTGKALGTFEKNSHTASGARGMAAIESDARHLARHVANVINDTLRK